MSILSILYNVFLMPLQLLMETIYSITYACFSNPGICIMILSFFVNLIILPLYTQAELLQQKQHDMEKKLQKGIRHIKRTFKKDEQFMMLQTFYRQNNYRPTDSLIGAIPLLLEIPFFSAAYMFLSTLGILENASFLFIDDLSKPDGLLKIFSHSVNVLPIIMTIVNLLSAFVFTKGKSTKLKLQTFVTACIFLIILYNSPSGLVLYWLCNNVFSLGKNICNHIPNIRYIFKIIYFYIGLYLCTFIIRNYFDLSICTKCVIITITILFMLPLYQHKKPIRITSCGSKLFNRVLLLNVLMTGLLIPSATLLASPQEFLNSIVTNPFVYLISSLSISIGVFLIWMNAYYKLASNKALFEFGGCVLCILSLINYLGFSSKFGTMNDSLIYHSGLNYSNIDYILSFMTVVLVTIFVFFIMRHKLKWMANLLTLCCICILIIFGCNVYQINDVLSDVSGADVDSQQIASIPLSKDGQNVVVLVLDRAISGYVPYLINENPELIDMFDGFTYYKNSLAFGGNTNFAMPAVFGGYEYTPYKLNERTDELLSDKHNEALQVLPSLFSENGYEVTVCDPPYVNYNYVYDLSIYDEYENVNAYQTIGSFSDDINGTINDESSLVINNFRNFFYNSFMQTSAAYIQPLLYCGGTYNILDNSIFVPTITFNENQTLLTESRGTNCQFMKSYNVLVNLSNITQISSSSRNTFSMLVNETTHEPCILDESNDYIPCELIDNRQYDTDNVNRFSIDKRQLHIENAMQMGHYQSNMAAFLRIGEWLDWLRENEVYDNTRIIIVSDHGYYLGQFDELLVGDTLHTSNGDYDYNDLSAYTSLLMVKDFNQSGFTVSDDFMTNADVPTLATNDVISEPVNPFTGERITSDEKMLHPQYVLSSPYYDVHYNNGNQFIAGKWYAVTEDVWNKNNWSLVSEESTLPLIDAIEQ